MSLLSERDKAEVTKHLAEHLRGPVTLVLFTTGRRLVELPGQGPDIAGEMSEHARALAADLAECSPQLTVQEHDLGSPEAVQYQVDKAPAFALVGAQDYGIRYYGLPAGHDAAAFLADLIDVGNGSTALAQATRDALAALPGDVHLQVFVTPT